MEALSPYVSMQVQHKAMQSRQKHLYARGAGADSESDDEHAVGEVMSAGCVVCALLVSVSAAARIVHTHTHTHTHIHTRTHSTHTLTSETHKRR